MQIITLTIDDKIANFIENKSQGNKNSYIIEIIKEHYEKSLKHEIITALKEDIADF